MISKIVPSIRLLPLYSSESPRSAVMDFLNFTSARGIERNDPRRQRFARFGVEPVVLEETQHGGAARKAFYRLGEVLVRPAFARQRSRQAGQAAVQIKAIEAAQRERRQGKIQDEHAPGRFQHAAELAYRERPGTHVSQPEGDGHGIKGRVGERQKEAVRGDEVRQALGAGSREHRMTKIRADDSRVWKMAAQRQSQVAAAGGDVQDYPGIPGAKNGGGAPAPIPVEPAAKEMVRPVVAERDGCEQRPDGSRSFKRARIFRHATSLRPYIPFGTSGCAGGLSSGSVVGMKTASVWRIRLPCVVGMSGYNVGWTSFAPVPFTRIKSVG